MLLQLLQYLVLQFMMRHCHSLVVFFDVPLLFFLLYFALVHQWVGQLARNLHVWLVIVPHYSCTGFLLLHLDDLSWLQMQYFGDLPRHHPRQVVLRASPQPLYSQNASLILLAFALDDEDIWVIFLILRLKKELRLLYIFRLFLVIWVHGRLNGKLHFLGIALASHGHIHCTDINLFLVFRKESFFDLVGDLKQECLPVKKWGLSLGFHLFNYYSSMYL